MEKFDINVCACAILFDGDGGGIAGGFAEAEARRHHTDGGKHWAVARYVAACGEQIVDTMRQKDAVGEGVASGRWDVDAAEADVRVTRIAADENGVRKDFAVDE